MGARKLNDDVSEGLQVVSTAHSDPGTTRYGARILAAYLVVPQGWRRVLRTCTGHTDDEIVRPVRCTTHKRQLGNEKLLQHWQRKVASLPPPTEWLSDAGWCRISPVILSYPQVGVVRVTWPFLHFEAQAISLEQMKLNILNLVRRLNEKVYWHYTLKFCRSSHVGSDHVSITSFFVSYRLL